MIQRPQRLLPCVVGQRTTCRHVSSLLLMALIVIGLPVLSGAQQTCQPDGDVDQNGSVTVADALLAFQQALSLADLSACQQSVADVFPQPSAPDGNTTASDAFCIFQKALSLPSCLDILPPNEPPLANAGTDRIVVEGAVITLSGSGSDSDGVIVSHTWKQTGGTRVSIAGAARAAAAFTAPEVSIDETLTFQLTVTDDDGATDSDDANVTVGTGIEGFISVSAGYHHTCGLRETGSVECWGRDEYGQSTPLADTFTSLSAGGFHTCGVRETGAVTCWGDNDYGQSTPPAGTFTSVGAGGLFTPAGCVRQVPWNAGVQMPTANPHRLRAPSPRSVPGAFTPAECATPAPWNAGVGMATVSPRRLRARLLRSVPESSIPAGCVRPAPWNAGVQMAMIDPHRLRVRLSRSVPGTITPAGCARQTPWNAGVQLSMAGRRRLRARLSRSAPGAFTPAGCPRPAP